MSSPDLIAGRYRIISQLGEGGMGVAYRAWDNERDVPVVVKMPKADKESDSDFIERFNREIKAMAGMTHPHIVPVVGFGQDIDGRPYVAMRFLPGGSLSDRRRRGPDKQTLPSHPSLLHQWLPSISDALDVVHRAGLVHRDVKPDNIFFDARWNAFLGDFGVAKVVNAVAAFPKDETITKTGIAVGTYAYMAPEVWSNKPVAASDQYSLAVAVYEMLAGMRPFTGEFGELARGHIIDPPPPLLEKQPHLPSRLCEAVHRALAKKPEDRFGTCVDFAAAVLEGVPAPLRREGVTRVMCPACRVMLDLDEKVAGKSGKCKTCSTSVKVAADLESVWLLGESQAAAGQGDHKPPKTPSTFGNTGQESSDSSTAARSLKSVVLTDIVVPPAVMALVPEEVARTLGIFPVKIENGRLQVAIGDPVDGESHEKVRAKLKNPLVEFLYAPEWEIATAIRQHYTKQRDPLLVAPGCITESNTAAGGSDARRESLGEEMWRKHEQPRLIGLNNTPVEHVGDYQGTTLVEVLTFGFLSIGVYQWYMHGWQALGWYFKVAFAVVCGFVVMAVVKGVIKGVIDAASQDKGEK